MPASDLVGQAIIPPIRQYGLSCIIRSDQASQSSIYISDYMAHSLFIYQIFLAKSPSSH